MSEPKLTPREQVEAVADDHWGYTEMALKAAGCDETLIKAASYFYIEA